jgi:hypothetical protein
VVSEISRQSQALVAKFGASDAAVLDVVFGQYIPLQPGDKLLVNALRIGYTPATAEYVR